MFLFSYFTPHLQVSSNSKPYSSSMSNHQTLPSSHHSCSLVRKLQYPSSSLHCLANNKHRLATASHKSHPTITSQKHCPIVASQQYILFFSNTLLLCLTCYRYIFFHYFNEMIDIHNEIINNIDFWLKVKLDSLC